MKRVIKNTLGIFGMSVPRPKALDILSKNSETLAYHLIKCVVYGKSLGESAFEHWVEEEICEYLSIANDVLTKPKNRKLKSEDYKDTIFADMGDSRQDASIALRNFRIMIRRNKKYPDFEISSDLIDRVYVTFQNVINRMIPILISKNDLRTEDFAPEVYKAIQ